MADMTRREFLTTAGLIAGSAVVLATVPGCGSGTETKKVTVETPSRSYEGDATMGKRVLVGYATRTGSTTGVAEKIGATLAERGFAVDVRPLRERPSLDGYDAVVLGSAINGAAWLPEAMSYLEGHAAALAKVPTAVFCVHSMNIGPAEKAVAKRHAYLDKVRQQVKPCDEGYFAGMGPDPDDTSLIARWAFKAFGGGGEGDMRDWPAITAWAQELTV